MFRKTVYILVKAASIELTIVEKNIRLDVDSTISFGSSRMVLSNFSALESSIKKGLDSLGINQNFLRLGPKVLMHPLDIFSDGLTEVESIALKQAAIGAGASEAFVFTGDELALNKVKEHCCD